MFPFVPLLVALALVGLIGWFDYATGWEWSVFAPYAVPLVLVAWKAGWRVGILFSSLCAAVFWASHAHENPYHSPGAFALAVFGRWFYFNILVAAVAILKSHRELERAQITALENARRLEGEILDASELEQQCIGRDLHDGLGPHLAAIGYAATFLENELRRRAQPETCQAAKIREMAGSAALLAQNLARCLFIVPMEGPGLSIALGEMARATSSMTPMPVSFLETGEPHVEHPVAGVHLYRIACEAVNNAVKHSRAGKVTIALSQSEGSLRLTVADDGCGMDSATNGSFGMGLPSFRSRARALGGELTLESSPGNGTVISCEIPEPPQTRRPPLLMSESSTAANKKVLIVEDHPVFRAMLAQLIGQEPGIEVCGEVDNITDAMSLIECSLPDMAVVDITLQGLSGLEWIKNLKARRIHLPILVLSMHAEALYAERVLRAGAKGYISKLEPPAEVMAAIRKVMDGGIHVSRLVSDTIVGRLGHADQAQRPSGLDLLSDREIEVFQLIGRGMNSPEIAAHTRLGTSTVDSYRARIKLKLGVRNAAALYQYAARWLAESGL